MIFEWLKKLFGKEEMKPMIDDATCIQRLMLNEGCKLKSYRCPAGKLTIGIGRNLDDNPLTIEEIQYVGHNGRCLFISNDQANYLCRNDLKRVRAELDKNLSWWRDLNIDRQFVMIDLLFNMGIKTLLTFKKTLNSIALGNYELASKQLLQSKYAKQVGARAERNAYCLKYGTYLTKLPKEW